MNSRKIILKKDEAKSKLLQNMGHRSNAISREAQEIFAGFIGPIVEQTLDQAATANMIYDMFEYDPDTDDTRISLEFFHDISEGLIDIYAQTTPAGLPTNHITGPVDDFRIPTYRHDTAVSMKKCFARQSRFDMIQLVLQRVVQELLVKREFQAWTPILQALANYRNAASKLNLITSTTSGVLAVDDFNRLWTKVARNRVSWACGTPTYNPCKGITDLFLSPELLEDVRSFAYEPQNTFGIPNSDEATALGLPDGIREQIWNNAGAPSIFGIKITALNELGIGQVWNDLFDSFYTAGGGDPAFTGASDELALALDLSCGAFQGAIGKWPCENSALEVMVDDQWAARSEKIGWTVGYRAGFAVVDAKAVTGLIV